MIAVRVGDILLTRATSLLRGTEAILRTLRAGGREVLTPGRPVVFLGTFLGRTSDRIVLVSQSRYNDEMPKIDTTLCGGEVGIADEGIYRAAVNQASGSPI